MPRKSLAARVAAAAVLVSAAIIPVTSASAVTWGANYFPNVPLTTQDGKTVHFFDDLLKGKKVVINFIYTKCGDSCPLETARMAQVQRILGARMGRDIFFYSFSIDPVRDTPAELKSYAQKFHTGPGWLFLTGKKADIELIRRKLGQQARAEDNELTDHSTSLMIGNVDSGEWIKDSSLDNPQYIAAMIRDWLSDYSNQGPVKSYTEATPLPEYVSNTGAYLFQTRCAACHTIGQGDSVGPDLLGVTKNRKREWLTNFIALPNVMIAKKDPLAVSLYARYNQLLMPNLRLNDVDLKNLLGFLEAQDALPRGQAKAEAPAAR